MAFSSSSNSAAKVAAHSAQDPIVLISQRITQLTGVQLGDKQRPMVESRMAKRVAELGLSSAAEYLEYLDKNEAQETPNLISLLTTHHTFFFREFNQFEFLADKVLTPILAEVRKRPNRTLKVWSAACSRGQEVYSLAMFLQYHLKHLAPDVKFTIHGTDVDANSVQISKNGVYHRNEIKEAPLVYLADHWARGSGDISDFVKAKPSIREHLSFDSVNLLDFGSKMSGQKFDIIFCRNVFIYFTPDQIRQSTQQLINHLEPHGHLFVGISETLSGLQLPLQSKGPSVYAHSTLKAVAPANTFSKGDQSAPVVHQRPGAPTSANLHSVPTNSKSAGTSTDAPQVLKVFCIDDSTSIHTLLKQVLKKEQGFELVGSAINGLDAAAKLKGLPNVDVITLDIHMPEQDGIEYLKKNFGPNHPPVVMITSVSRENADLALKSLELGASDFIEKPALNNLLERGEEIRAKLRTAYKTKKLNRGITASLGLDQQFKKTIQMTEPDKKARLMLLSLSDQGKLINLFKEMPGVQPPLYLLIEGAEPALPAFAKQLSHATGKTIHYQEVWSAVAKPGDVFIMDFKKSFDAIKLAHAKHRVSVMVFGDVAQHTAQKILEWPGVQLLLEDFGNRVGATHLQEVATDVFPATSFPYVSCEFLSKGDGK